MLSIYTEKYDSGIASLVFSKWIFTDLKMDEIENLLQLQDGFHSEFTYGQTLSFFDIYFFVNCEETITKIQAIPEGTPHYLDKRVPTFLRVEEFNPGIADEAVPLFPSKVFLYSLSRYERGASGYSAIVYWMSTHPLEMVFIGGFLYDCAKIFICKVWSKISGRGIWTSTSKPVVLRLKRFYKNFEALTQINSKDCQIIKIKQMKSGKLNIIVRTVKNEQYQIVTHASGKIEKVAILKK